MIPTYKTFYPDGNVISHQQLFPATEVVEGTWLKQTVSQERIAWFIRGYGDKSWLSWMKKDPPNEILLLDLIT